MIVRRTVHDIRVRLENFSVNTHIFDTYAEVHKLL